jgi:hypothetical protein
MRLDQSELRELLSRVIFAESAPTEWVQDVWDLNPILGESAAKLWDTLELLLENCPDETIERFVQSLYRQSID